MAISANPKKELRPIPVTIRLSKRGADQLRKLSEFLNKSQGEIVDELVSAEFKAQEKKK